MTLEKTGYGVGAKEFPAANCVRAFLGEVGDPQQAEIVELCCHIDDMTAEALAFAGEQLLDQGALDVSSIPLTMKKGRAGIAFTVLCRPRDEERLAQAMLRQTAPTVSAPAAAEVHSLPLYPHRGHGLRPRPP